MRASCDLSLLTVFTVLLFFFFSSPTCAQPMTRWRTRRALLHVSFFPPAQAPSVTSNTPPKFPSSSTNSPGTVASNLPFFPLYSFPPPPPPSPSSSASSSLPTFPANISSALASPSPSSRRRFSPSTLLRTVLLSLLSVLLLLLSALLFVHLLRRHNAGASKHADARSDSLRLVPDPTSAAIAKPSPNPSTEFLYLGTLVSPLAGGGVSCSGSAVPSISPAATGSPELRPLPPLPRYVGQSSGEQLVPAGSRSSDSSASDEPNSSSPTLCSSSTSRSAAKRHGKQCRSAEFHPPPLPPPKLMRMRPPSPSPPKRRAASAANSPSLGAKAASFELMSRNSITPGRRAPVIIPPSYIASSMRNAKSLSAATASEMFIKVNHQTNHSELSSSDSTLAREPKSAQNEMQTLFNSLSMGKEHLLVALHEGNAQVIGMKNLQILAEMLQIKDEQSKQTGNSLPKTGPPEAFLDLVCAVPFVFKRVDAMLYIASFETEICRLRKQFSSIEDACEELKHCRLFDKVLDVVLKTGYFMTLGTDAGNAHAYKLDTLLKLADFKAADGKTTLLHIILQEVCKTEGYKLFSRSRLHKFDAFAQQQDLECRMLGLKAVEELVGELKYVRKAAAINLDGLSSEVYRIAVGIGKIHDILRLNAACISEDSDQKFHATVSAFLSSAERELQKLQAQENIMLAVVKDVTDYISSDFSYEEARRSNVFTRMTDFLAILDDVCKEIGDMYSADLAASRDTSPLPHQH